MTGGGVRMTGGGVRKIMLKFTPAVRTSHALTYLQLKALHGLTCLFLSSDIRAI